MVYQKNGKIEIAEMSDELAMLNVENGEYITINEVGKDIWELLDGSRSTEGIVESLMNIYEVKAEQCRTEVDAFLTDLETKGLVSRK